MNMENITLQDCIDMMQKKGQAAVINDGQVVTFVTEKVPVGAGTK